MQIFVSSLSQANSPCYNSVWTTLKKLWKGLYSTCTCMLFAVLRDVLLYPLHYLDPRSEGQYTMQHVSLLVIFLVVLKEWVLDRPFTLSVIMSDPLGLEFLCAQRVHSLSTFTIAHFKQTAIGEPDTSFESVNRVSTYANGLWLKLFDNGNKLSQAFKI